MSMQKRTKIFLGIGIVGVALLAGVAIATRNQPVSTGTSGTIGAVPKLNEKQIDNKDVILGNGAGQSGQNGQQQAAAGQEGLGMKMKAKEDGSDLGKGVLAGKGTLDNKGVLAGKGTLDNKGVLAGKGTLDNKGVLAGKGTLDNKGVLAGKGTLDNKGVLAGKGTLDNKGVLAGKGTLDNKDGANLGHKE